MRFYSYQRAALFQFVETVELVSTSPDRSLTNAITFLLANKSSRRDWLLITSTSGEKLNLAFVSERWWTMVTGQKGMNGAVTEVNRRSFEMCVLTQIMQELKSGDLCIPGSDQYSDYREQLVNDEEMDQSISSYGERAGVPVGEKAFVAALKEELERAAAKADQGFPENEYLHIENGEPVLKRLRREPDPEGLQRFDRLVKDRMTPVGILDALVDTQEWLNWTKHFGPISGHDPKLENPRQRYIVTTFCYGFGFGPTQTSRSIRGLDRRQVAFVNHRHVTEEKLNDAITTVINGYNQFDLRKIWGLGYLN